MAWVRGWPGTEGSTYALEAECGERRYSISADSWAAPI